MKHLPSSRPLLLTLGLLLAPAAHAAEPAEAPAAAPTPQELVALHPCAVVGEKKKELISSYQAVCASEFENVPRVPAEQVLAFLETQPNKSCAKAPKTRDSKTPDSKTPDPAEVACLGRLANAAQASRALLVTIIRLPNAWRTHGLVVDTQGTVLKDLTIQKSDTGDAAETLIRTALGNLHRQLNPALPQSTPVAKAPPPPTLAVPPPSQPVAEAPPPAPQPSEPAQGPERSVTPSPSQAAPAPLAVQSSSTPRPWMRPAAYASAGTGVAALVLAGVFGLQSNSAMADSNKFYENNAYPAFNQLTEIASLRDQARTKRTLAFVSAGAGAVLIGGGAWLWFQGRPTDRPTSPAPGVAALSVGPNGVSVLGFLP